MFKVFVYPLDKMIEKVYNESKLKITSLKQILQKPQNNKIMKNLIFSLILGVVLIFCNSCHDDYTPVVVKQYTIEAKNDSAIGGTITPSSVTVNSGSDITLTITPDFGCLVKELKVNGTTVTLTTPTTYILKNVTADTKVVVTFQKSLNWYLTQKPWAEDSILAYNSDGTIDTYDLRSGKHVYTFLKNGRLNVLMNDGTNGDLGTWNLDETQKPVALYTGDYPYEIIKLDENIMILNDPKNISINKSSGIIKWVLYYSHNIPK